jgi:hypothetical protein
MGTRSHQSTSSHPSRRKPHHHLPPAPPVYSRDFAYPNNEPQLVLPGPRMARPSIRDASASLFAEYVLSFLSPTSPTALRL